MKLIPFKKLKSQLATAGIVINNAKAIDKGNTANFTFNGDAKSALAAFDKAAIDFGLTVTKRTMTRIIVTSGYFNNISLTFKFGSGTIIPSISKDIEDKAKARQLALPAPRQASLKSDKLIKELPEDDHVEVSPKPKIRKSLSQSLTETAVEVKPKVKQTKQEEIEQLETLMSSLIAQLATTQKTLTMLKKHNVK